MKLLPLPQQLFMELPSFGFTGTSEGMTIEQGATLVHCLYEAGIPSMDEWFFHFGDCVGADKEAFDIVTDLCPFTIHTIAHPGNTPEMRAYCKAEQIRAPMDNLQRDGRIAYLAHQGLFATPHTFNETLRSGTWATVRKAWKLGRRIWVIKPDGTIEYEFKSVLVKQALSRKDEVEWGL